MNKEEMTRIFAEIGKDHGYDEVGAEFAAFKEFKIKWQISNGRAEFQVSDYVKDAPAQIIGDIARTLFSRICGNESDYPESMAEWTYSENFVNANQERYIRRSKGIKNNRKGMHRDLNDSVGRLLAAGLISEDDVKGVFLCWMKNPSRIRVSDTSGLMKVISISPIFDTEVIAESVLDFTVYINIIYIMQKHKYLGSVRGAEIDELKAKYPNAEESERYIRCLGLSL